MDRRILLTLGTVACHDTYEIQVVGDGEVVFFWEELATVGEGQSGRCGPNESCTFTHTARGGGPRFTASPSERFVGWRVSEGEVSGEVWTPYPPVEARDNKEYSGTATFAPQDCPYASTVLHEGDPLDVGALDVISCGSGVTSAQTCGGLTGGGAQEVNDETTMEGELALALLRVSETLSLEMSLAFESPFRQEAPDLDFFIAETTITDPWFVQSPQILARFNGTANPELGSFDAEANDYLLIIHNYVDGPATFTLDITATPP